MSEKEEYGIKYIEMEYSKDRLEKAKVLAEGKLNGFQFVILNLGAHPCCYVAINKDSKLFGLDYDLLPIRCHGGLTFANDKIHTYDESGEVYWFGWDYGHHGDFAGYYIGDPIFEKYDYKKWTTKELLNDVWSVTYDFAELGKFINKLTETEVTND